MRHTTPNVLDNKKRLLRSIAYRTIKLIKRLITVYANASERTSTNHKSCWDPVIKARIIQGTPKQIRMSNVFEPILFDTAIEPLPCFDTINEEKTSGIEVPTAKNDSPMTVSGTRMVYPMTVMSQVTS